MHSDSHQNGSARVRHVPIHIESRSGNDGQSPNQNQSRTVYSDGQNAPQNRYTNTYRDHSQASPDTSNIDIRYKPPPPNRNQSPQETSANRQQQYKSSPPNYNDSNQQQKYQHQQPSQQRHQEERSVERERPNSSGSMSPNNSDKLVNSPEPIPLPPPPKDEFNSRAANGGCNDSFGSPNVDRNQYTPEQQHQPDQHHQQQQQQQQHQRQQQPEQRNSSVMDRINSVKTNVMALVQEITKFEGISGQSKEYRYLEEMLTRCVLNLDGIECGDSSELRQQRKATIKLVDRATDILQKKLQINTDIHKLSESMTTPIPGPMNDN